MIKELKMKIKFTHIEKAVNIPVYVEMKHGEILNTSYDKIAVKEAMLDNKRNYFFQKGETPQTKKEVMEFEKKLQEEIVERYNQEIKKFKKTVDASLGRLTEKGKKFLFKVEDQKNV